MVKLVPLTDIFDIEYGNQLDRNKLSTQGDGVNFVSRSSQGLGIESCVRPVSGLTPYPAGLITVTLGGTYLLSAYVQPEPFYTAQNIKVLKPKLEMTFNVKVYYCLLISRNRFRYTSHGREANKTFDRIMVPALSALPDWVSSATVAVPSTKLTTSKKISLAVSDWRPFKLGQLFQITRGVGPRKNSLSGKGTTPFVTSIDSNNGWTSFTDSAPTHQGGVITVNRNGSVGEAFYQPIAFATTEDVHVLTPRFSMSPHLAMFLITLIRRERYRFSYGRKWGLGRMEETAIFLPVKQDGSPDWDLMSEIIKSLPYADGIS